MAIQKYCVEFGKHQFSLIFHKKNCFTDVISVKNEEKRKCFDGNGTNPYGVVIVQFQSVLLIQYLFQ